MIHPFARPILAPLTVAAVPSLTGRHFNLLLERVVAATGLLWRLRLRLQLQLRLLFDSSRVLPLQVIVPLLV